MPLDVGGTTYHSAADVAEAVGVTRQTLWRWRQAGKVPQGRKYRGREVLFTGEELIEVREYAHRIEPLEGPTTAKQLKLFAGGGNTAGEG